MYIIKIYILLTRFSVVIALFNFQCLTWTLKWGYSSVGRAPALQAGGREFESLYLHLGAELSAWSEAPKCTLKTI